MKLFAEVNMPKAEAAIRAAAEKESVAAKLRAQLPEQAPQKPRKKTKVKEPER